MDEGYPTSDYAESAASSEFTSMRMSRVMHTYEDGRRYQGFVQGRYGMPNDELEQERESIKHKLYVDYILEGSCMRSPIGTNPQKIVDMGTGFGFWPQDVADQFPSARVIGIDITPVQPQWIVQNLEFRVEDVDDDERPWTNIYADADLIHNRALLQTIRNPRRFLQRAFDNLKPGGWLESHHVIPSIFSDDDTVDSEHPMNMLYRLVEGKYAAIYGWNFDVTATLAHMLREIGFTNINEKNHAVPLGRWPSESRKREMGMFNLCICQDWCFTVLANRRLGLSDEEVRDFGLRIEAAFSDHGIHAQNHYHECWAQKPFS